ncbi:MAG: sensor domain-containing diguanylate cyclase [Myxococcaceae bacterium]|nr:sensor domain-containing diguanylate cyclase [Myxococcaceae bacterium]
MNPTDLLSAMKRTVEQVAAFNELAKALTSTLDVHQVLQLVMQKVSELLRPTNWSLLLFDEKTGELYFEIAVGARAERLKSARLLPGEGIAGAVFQSGEPRRVDDVRSDPAFAGRFDEVSAFETRSVMAVPLRVRGRSLGVIELVNGPEVPPFTDEDLQTLQGIAEFAAIAIDNARNFQAVQELTISDEHTGLFNARHLRALLEDEVERADRFGHPLSLIFLDLDHFKQVNDTWGHLVGSALLREVGELLSACIRGVDSAFRYGGDEFAVLLIETDAQSARAVAERIRDRFRATTFHGGRGLKIRVTASIGYASMPDHARSPTALLEAADRAMYQVKAHGRDGVAGATA